MSPINVSREELYRRVWSTPTAQLAQEFGISDVAIAKACRRLQIPKPPRGYWARLAAGQKVKRTPLRKLPRPPPLTVSQQRTAALAADPPLEGEEADTLRHIVPLERIELPQNNRRLHPVARALREELLLVRPDERDHDLLKITDRKDLPRVSVSRAMVDPLVRSFHAVLSALEERGVEFKASRSKYQPPEFHCGKDSLAVSIEEPIISVTREATEMEKRFPSWEWRLSSTQPAGYLNYLPTSGERYERRRDKRDQKVNTPLEVMAAQVVEQIWDIFMRRRRERVEEQKRWERERAERAAREERERISRHKNSLDEIAHRRVENLVRAAQWWAINNVTADYIQSCEDRWRLDHECLTPDEEAWLNWARQSTATFPVADFAYPDPALDGVFDPSSVLLGGPYPKNREIPRPPTMPAPPLPPETEHHHHYHREPQQYPFWLKYQR